MHAELADCLIYESFARSGLAVAGAATDARQTSGTTRHATRTRELAAGAATDAREAALPARTATGAVELAAGTAVAAGIASAAARILLEDHMRGCRASHRRASRESFSSRHRRNSNRRSNSSTNNQRFHQIQFR
jgi:threonine dehydratase